MSEWQPIETAPKDGTRVLLTARIWAQEWNGLFDTDATDFPNATPPSCAFRQRKCGPVYEGFWSEKHSETGWFSYNSYEFLKPPTHWMPLPEPPEESI